MNRTLTPREWARLSLRYGSRYVAIMHLGEFKPWDGRDVYLEHVRALREAQARMKREQKARAKQEASPPWIPINVVLAFISVLMWLAGN